MAFTLGIDYGTNSVRGALEQASKDGAFSADQVIGIGVDTTGSSPLPVDERNIPLSLREKWKDDLAAQCWLWKDHTGYHEVFDAAYSWTALADYVPAVLAGVKRKRRGEGQRILP